ncbi:MAG: monovalent cation/H(+) antiporter subunit G [Chloroflexi bacterium]|nr:monovalent cation/H(+) antiporter subunit G [Chloroflexota bacterium]
MPLELTLREGVALLFVTVGAGFIFIAGLGIIRMPDLFLRMSTTTKAATLGVGSVLLGAIIFFSADLGVETRALAAIIFLLLTAPVSAHMIGRAGYADDAVRLWEGTIVDEMANNFNKQRVRTGTDELRPIKLNQADRDRKRRR